MGIFQQCFHGYLWHSSAGSEPVSGNVTLSFRPMSLQPLSGKRGTQRDMGDGGEEGGGVVVIICAYEEGWSSLVASSRQLL